MNQKYLYRYGTYLVNSRFSLFFLLIVALKAVAKGWILKKTVNSKKRLSTPRCPGRLIQLLCIFLAYLFGIIVDKLSMCQVGTLREYIFRVFLLSFSGCNSFILSFAITIPWFIFFIFCLLYCRPGLFFGRNVLPYLLILEQHYFVHDPTSSVCLIGT